MNKKTYRSLFSRSLQGSDRRRREYSTNLLLMAQALERAGDHAKNLGEELFHLVGAVSVHEREKSDGVRWGDDPALPWSHQVDPTCIGKGRRYQAQVVQRTDPRSEYLPQVWQRIGAGSGAGGFG